MSSAVKKDISLAQLRYFVEAAEWGSMTAAADELFVAQSAVSTAIANLEAAVGAQLFIRRRAKGLQLTPAGARFLAQVRGVLGALDDAVVEASPENTAGRVSVGCFRTLAPFHLPAIVTGLEQDHPELQVDVAELSAEQVDEALRDQSIEMALTYDLGLGPDIEREVLAQVPLYAAVSIRHPLAERRTVSLAELVDEPMVLLNMPVSRDYFLQAFADHGLRPTVRYRFVSYEAVRAMVASGHGFALLNQQAPTAMTYAGVELRHLAIAEATRPLDIVLARRASGRPPTRKAALFAEQCRRSVGSASAQS